MGNYTREEILQMVEEEDVEFIRLQFTDMFGAIKNIAVTARELPRALNNQCVIDGEQIAGTSGLKDADLYLRPVLDTFAILPWRPQQGKVARMICDLYFPDGTPYKNSPRYILENVAGKAQDEGYTCYIDPECEFFLFHTDDNGNPTTVTHEQAGYLDISPLDLGENARRDMVLTLEDMGSYRNYWGYGTGYYFAPKAAYAAFDDAQTELKDLVKACHKAGIEVVLEMPFTEKILPQTALECLRFYLLEYHVDGFVVNPYNVPWDSLNADPILKGAKIFKKEEGFQNSMRRFLKGDEGMVREVIRQLCRRTPEDGCCNYITSHTGFTLCDLVSYDGKHNEANGERNQDGPDYNYSWNCGTEGPSRKRSVMTLRKNQMKNAFLLLLLSQGTPCILAGDEFGNSREFKAAQELARALNDYGWNEKRFALATTTFHQTLQQTLFRTIVEILTVYADPQRRTDLRNEASKEGAKKLMEVLEELHIPFI